MFDENMTTRPQRITFDVLFCHEIMVEGQLFQLPLSSQICLLKFKINTEINMKKGHISQILDHTHPAYGACANRIGAR